MNDLSGGDDSACRTALRDAAGKVVDYRGARGLASAPELRSMLADVLGAQGVRCRADLDLLVTVATAAGGLTDVCRPGLRESVYADHLRAVATEAGLAEPEVQWAGDVWRAALGVSFGPSRPATELPTNSGPADPTVLPDPDYVVGTEMGRDRAAPDDAKDEGSGDVGDIGDTTLPPEDGATSTVQRVAVVASLVLGAVLLVAIGAFLWLQRDNSDGPTVPSTTPGSTAAATTAAEPEVSTVWASTTEPDADQTELLEQQATMFAEAETCRPIADGDPDPLGTYPRDEDEASIECAYAGGRRIVYSLFADDAAMEAFFEGRLEVRRMRHGQGQIGPVPPWQLDYTDDPERGSGSMFGFQRQGDGARSEVGFIRTGLSIYAYSYQMGTDYPGYYEWWSGIFGGPASGT